ncbi:hypothetical protein [Pseudodesulfovibrio sediminis]|uniref:Lipoprotein n=1 Tax=Pseudodesulfovibrio sediminis TaxID=2810563 RepID=A0ABM7P814_9BACT|nr:hypothetical protein [Pseudodesulfovibrio sediminis]BCS89061.1 hypothetical protein PSDVSF_23030 [Pseudodesulfovibrio sediminis]
MRTIYIVLTLTLILTLAACGGKEVEEPMAETAAVAEPTAPAEEAAVPAPDNGSTNPISDIVPAGPAGSVQLKDGTILELTKFNKIGKYYIYISGNLNGRSSTVISLTRFQDVARWKTIMFKGKENFLILSKQGKELAFLNSYLYIGNDSGDTYSFYTTTRDLKVKLVEVKKDDVASININ